MAIYYKNVTMQNGVDKSLNFIIISLVTVQ